MPSVLSFQHSYTTKPQEPSLVVSKTKLASSSAAATTLGFLGHSGLFLASIVLVKAVYAVVAPPKPEYQPAGILNRCPWPFILFHDPKQFVKDSPTWMIATWIALWRITKMVLKQKAGVVA